MRCLMLHAVVFPRMIQLPNQFSVFTSPAAASAPSQAASQARSNPRFLCFQVARFVNLRETQWTPL